MGIMGKVAAAAAAKDIEAGAKDVLAKVNAFGLSDEQKFGAAVMARQIVAAVRARDIIGPKTEEELERCISAFLPATDGKG